MAKQQTTQGPVSGAHYRLVSTGEDGARSLVLCGDDVPTRLEDLPEVPALWDDVNGYRPADEV